MDSSSKGFFFPPFLSLQIQNITSKFPLPVQLCHLNPNNILLHSSFGIRSVLAGEEMFLVMNVNCSTNCLSGIFFFLLSSWEELRFSFLFRIGWFESAIGMKPSFCFVVLVEIRWSWISRNSSLLGLCFGGNSKKNHFVWIVWVCF